MLRKMCRALPMHQKVVKEVTAGAYGVFLGGMAMDSAVMRMGALHPEMYPRIYRFGKPNWVCDAKSQFLKNKWGQPIDYAPLSLFQITQELYPDYPIEEPLTFEMMGSAVTRQREIMRELGVHVFDKEVVGMTEDSDNGDLLVQMEGGEVERIPSGGNHYVVNAAREVILPKGVPDDVCQCIQSADNLYTKVSGTTESRPPNERERIIIFGGGRNLDWALMHFPDADIIHVIPKGGSMHSPRQCSHSVKN